MKRNKKSEHFRRQLVRMMQGDASLRPSIKKAILRLFIHQNQDLKTEPIHHVDQVRVNVINYKNLYNHGTTSSVYDLGENVSTGV